jgi:hypothetical protein
MPKGGTQEPLLGRDAETRQSAASTAEVHVGAGQVQHGGSVLDRAAKAPPLVKIDTKIAPRTNYAKTKVEPRVFWAAERTLLKYVLVSTILISIAMQALFDSNRVARYYSFVALAIAFCFVIYAAGVYNRRIFHILNRDPTIPPPTRYDDRIGPYLMSGLIALSVLLLFAASFVGNKQAQFTCPVTEDAGGCVVPYATRSSFDAAPLTIIDSHAAPNDIDALQSRIDTCLTTGPFSGQTFGSDKVAKAAPPPNTTWEVEAAYYVGFGGTSGATPTPTPLITLDYVRTGDGNSHELRLRMKAAALLAGALKDAVHLTPAVSALLTMQTLFSCGHNEATDYFQLAVPTAPLVTANVTVIDAPLLNRWFGAALRLNASAVPLFNDSSTSVLQLAEASRQLQSRRDYAVPLGDVVGVLSATAVFPTLDTRALQRDTSLIYLAVTLPAGEKSYLARRRAQALLMALRADVHVTREHKDFFQY